VTIIRSPTLRAARPPRFVRDVTDSWEPVLVELEQDGQTLGLVSVWKGGGQGRFPTALHLALPETAKRERLKR
jgi:hypothetical protein